MDAPSHGAGAAGAALRPVEQVPASCAYLIYTSGSTGRPKAVVVPRSSFDGFVAATRELYEVAAADRVLQFAAISFDTSAEEIYPALAAGATLVLRDEDMLASPTGFLDACARERVTVIDLPTAYWHELAVPLETGERTLGPPARLVILGGERVHPERLSAGIAPGRPVGPAAQHLRPHRGDRGGDRGRRRASGRPGGRGRGAGGGDRPAARPRRRLGGRLRGSGRCRSGFRGSWSWAEPASPAATWAARR